MKGETRSAVKSMKDLGGPGSIVTQTNMRRSISSLRRVRIPTSVFTTSSYCSEVSRDVQLDVLKSAVESVVTSKTPAGNLLDSIRSTAARQSCRVDIASGHFRWFGTASLMHQLVTIRLAVQLAKSHHTVCPDASVQYQNDNLRSHDISVWREDAETIKKNLMPNSDTRVDGAKVPPYVVIEIISPRSRQKDEFDIKQLCAVNGVEFYWLIHPKEGWIQVYNLSRAAPSHHIHRCTKSDARQMIPPFEIEIDLADIFM